MWLWKCSILSLSGSLVLTLWQHTSEQRFYKMKMVNGHEHGDHEHGDHDDDDIDDIGEMWIHWILADNCQLHLWSSAAKIDGTISNIDNPDDGWQYWEPRFSLFYLFLSILSSESQNWKWMGIQFSIWDPNFGNWYPHHSKDTLEDILIGST